MTQANPLLPEADQLCTIDLFAGAGGLTEGFRQAGFQCLYANDIDRYALETFRHNHPDTWAECESIDRVNPHVVRERLGLAPGELSVLVGGPPCQGFSINAPERFLTDPRNRMFEHYCRFLAEFRPQSFVFENVPGLLSLGRTRVFETIIQELRNLGYAVSARILFAAHYGVPQERWRLIILGSRLGTAPEHPYPTHYATGRANFFGGRTMTFQLMPLDSMALLPPVSVHQAIGDLPRLSIGEGGEIVEYNGAPHSDYARMMRANSVAVFNHFAGKLANQNLQRMRFIRPGGSWRDIPFELLPKGMQRARQSDHTKRYGRLAPDGLAGTVMTKCDPHWGAVFLPDQDRALTVREAARLQSFPDSYRFLGPRVSQYLQVGNAVPVLMARAIGGALASHLCSANAPRVAC